MKILIIDDHPLFLEGIKPVVNKLGENVELLTANCCEAALGLVPRHSGLSLVLLDLGLPDMDGYIVLKTSLENNPDVPVVILSASTQRDDMQRALAAGAKGFICKSSSPSVVINALRLVLAGGVYIPPEMVTVGNVTSTAGTTDSVSENNGQQSIHLTPRQLEVLSLLADGKGWTNKEIARKLGCSEATIKVHVTSILKSLGVVNRIQVKDAAEKLGLLTL